LGCENAKTFVHGVGGVLSADIAVPEHDRELKFYSAVLTTGDTPLWRDDLMNNLGAPVIGLGARTPEYESLPLQWMPHFQVADVGVSVASAIELGGDELWHSKNDDGQSQWAVLADPVGVAFGIIPVVPDDSDSTQQSEPFGCISWLSLTVSEAVPSRDFYQRVVGWNSTPAESGDGFEMQTGGGIPAAEICCGDDGQIPAVWMLHLPVGDLAGSLRRVVAHGGAVIKQDAKAKCAVVRDPVGVCFALQELGD